MEVSNTAAGAEITYQLYEAPDFENVIAQTNAPSFLTMPAGSYRVVAVQTLNGVSNVKQKDAVVQDLVEKLDFELTDSAAFDCALTATLTVDVLQGNPTLYEIIAGPVTRPLQTSNEFTDLASGTYSVRVFDDCNDALSKAYTFVIGNNDLNIGAPSLPNVFTSCTSMNIRNEISSNTTAPILYPLVVNYTVFAPDNTAAETFSQTIFSGNPSSFELVQNITLFADQLYSIKVEVTDNCGNTFVEEFVINPKPKVSVQEQVASCGELFFSVALSNYLPPFTLTFLEPAGFNATAYNANYLGVFLTSPVTFGSSGNVLPYGDYKIEVQDACGRIVALDFSLIKKAAPPSFRGTNNGCGSDFGMIKIKMPQNRTFASVVMIEAPAAFATPLPANLISFVNAQGVYIHSNLPVGAYQFVTTDNCGETHTVNVEIPAFVFGGLASITRPDCNPTSGAVRLSTSNGALVATIITAAPASFNFAVPYDVSTNINNDGVFYRSGLPAGNYSFEAVDSCGFTLETTVEIFGYTKNSSGFSINRKCGSFDITIDDTDASITGKQFWLQKYFSDTDTWGHPYTGVPFVAGTIPTSTTATGLSNFATLLNVFLIGEFRIIKVFNSFENGNPNAKCTDLYVDFTVVPELSILGAYNLSCDSGIGPDNVVIDVEGVAPFNFTMTAPTFVDNGTNNTFLDLAAGSYNFQAIDFCGSIKNVPVEIGNLLPLVRAIEPQSMLVCRTDGVQFGVFPLVNQTTQILGTQNPNTYIVTYHLAQSDADSGINPLPDGYTNSSNPQTIYARVKHKTLPLCYATTSFTIFAGITPILSPEVPVFICEGFTVRLTTDAGYSSYVWSTGQTTQSITISVAGTYTVTVKTDYEDFSCEATKNFVVTTSNKATIEALDIKDWSYNQNSVVVVATGLGTYNYSLDNINFQSSNTFTNLLEGEYTVYVKDLNGCGTVKSPFVLLNYPKYFTPNGDGYNDTWHIEFSNFEPNLIVTIFDRFGKLITRLKSGGPGWDGTYNGYALPSTDYWFVVDRQDGAIFKGHFSLKR
jgi:gliding motility-associated-like protein